MPPRKTAAKKAAPRSGGASKKAKSNHTKTPPAPTDLGIRGAALWTDLLAGAARFNPAQLVLALEACRIADRLERLDVTIRTDPTDTKALAEARMQAVALRQIVDSLSIPAVAPAETPAKDVVDELAEQRAARQAGR